MLDTKEYIDGRLKEIQTRRVHDCCKRHLIDELLDMKNFLDSELDKEIVNIQQPEGVANLTN